MGDTFANTMIRSTVLMLIFIMPTAHAADIRYTLAGTVTSVGSTVPPGVAEFGDTVTFEFTGNESPDNTHPNPENVFNSGNIYTLTVKVAGEVVFSSAAPIARLTIEAPNGSNPHIVQFSGGEQSFDGFSGGAVMRFGFGFFDFFPSAATILNPNLEALDSSSSIGFCFNGLEPESCVSAPRVDDYSYTLLVTDADGDGFADDVDNCTDADNPDQVDTDVDGFGNACDPDINNDCVVNFIDISAIADQFLGSNPLFDFNVDGSVNFIDLGIMTSAFGMAPGPSALASCDSQAGTTDH